MDTDRRQTERDAAAGDPDAEVRSLLERQRSGELSQRQLELLVHLGHEGARRLAGKEPSEPPADLKAWWSELVGWGAWTATAALVPLLERCVETWEATDRDDRPRRALHAFKQWRACPCAGHADLCRLRGNRAWTAGSRQGRPLNDSAFALRDACNVAFRLSNPGEPPFDTDEHWARAAMTSIASALDASPHELYETVRATLLPGALAGEPLEPVMVLDQLMTIFGDLPRAGPGSDDATRDALRRLPLEFERPPRVYDLGCGPGKQTLVLARELGCLVHAIDLNRPFLDRLKADAAQAGLLDLVMTQQRDMSDLDAEPESLDLIWSEGAVYILGFEDGLRLWRRYLKPGGLCVVTEATWFSDDPPAEARAFWEQAYPGMGTLAANRARAEAAGYEVLDAYPLPSDAWWPELYAPLRARMDELESGHLDPLLQGAIAESREEIALFERFHDAYGYAWYLLRKAGD